MISRRHILASALATPAILRFGPAQAATTLKISHQFSRRDHRQGRFSRPAVPQVRRRGCQEKRRRTRSRDLSGFVPDQDQGTVLGSPERRPRHQPVSVAVCRWRSAGDEYRSDARRGYDLRAGSEVEDSAGRQGVDRSPCGQGHRAGCRQMKSTRRCRPAPATPASRLPPA